MNVLRTAADLLVPVELVMAVTGGGGARVPSTVLDRLEGHRGAIEQVAREKGVPPALIAAIIVLESSGRADAVGQDGEHGLMQVLPENWYAWGIPQHRWTDPVTNIRGGVRVLKGEPSPLGEEEFNSVMAHYTGRSGDSLREYAEQVRLKATWLWLYHGWGV